MTLADILPFILGSGIGFSVGIFLGKMLERAECKRIYDEDDEPQFDSHD